MTGIGLYTDNLIQRLHQHTKDDEQVYLLGMDFFHNADRVRGCLSSNVRLKTNGMMHYGVYRRLWHWMPFLDYGRFFNVSADIFHFTNFVVPPYVKGKVITTIYDMVYRLYPETMEKANRVKLERGLFDSCRRADKIITISENSRQEIMDFLNVPKEKIHIIYPGVDTAYFSGDKDETLASQVSMRYDLPKQYFLYLGTLEPRKNIETILDAFRLYRQRYPQGHELVIAGKKGWQYEQIFKQVESFGLVSSVHFPGYVEEADKKQIYTGASAFLFPSLYEGFGMPPLEAMACGVPVIAANTASLPEAVGGGGLLIDPMDSEKMAEYMERLVEDQVYAQQLAVKGAAQARSFNWDNSVQALFQVYRELRS